MATSYKVLGQTYPSASTLTTGYTVPSTTEAVISTITVCNLGGAPDTFRIAIRPNGASIENKHYIAYDSSIAPQDTVTYTIGITLGDTDVVSVYSFLGTTSFNVFGSEIA